MKTATRETVRIIEYDNKYREAFRAINLEWLEKYDLTEPEDLRVLDDPTGEIIDRGGYVWLAISSDEIVGTAALLKAEESIFELAKMAVVPSFRGVGVGTLLLEACLQKASEVQCRKVVLYSNHRLKTALKMYEAYGFSYVALKNSPFKTADIMMERVC